MASRTNTLNWVALKMETTAARVPAVRQVDRFAVYRAYPPDGFCLFRHCMPKRSLRTRGHPLLPRDVHVMPYS